ncbi:pentapeptide repeat-containing protein [Pseudoalteromonas sp. SMS1]|uniref:pentapeptide repeat-containing protein n=1 Tax=Pseudoalteromonas sp. SMS1 TaxID=2908894 RepID=UPI001F1D804E|nr:pentapeptide repeat-containing protein [Pseudoalteromonas sp. SMS1]MCF2857173.1 pentapeptide repeat-containing protein [Pseudoalteromonas sp. SMS1]
MEQDLELDDLLVIDEESIQVISLGGDELLLLWLKGREAWNEWMSENPNANVHFENVVFSYEALKTRFPDNEDLQNLIKGSVEGNENFCFSSYKFNKYANFKGAQFIGSASFLGTEFEGEANFTGATFTEEVDFSFAIFNGEASFDDVLFESKVNFCRVLFNEYTSFYESTFGQVAYFGDASFNKRALFEATFVGKAYFDFVNFNSEAYFSGSIFNDEADFSHTCLSSSAKFDFATFKNKASFDSATFTGIAYFTDTIFESVTLFTNTTFVSNLIFRPINSEEITSLDFKGAAFEKSFSISGNYECIPDLMQTKTAHHVDLSKLTVKLKRSFVRNYGVEKAVNSSDLERLCRLKEIAESNKNYKRALAFHADEQRASRWIELNIWQSLLDCMYSVTSNYGQSILQPFLWFAFCVAVFAGYASVESNNEMLNNTDKYMLAVELSVSIVTPFISVSKRTREDCMKLLYQGERIRWLTLMSYLHAFFSFIFIFLIGLGLRNRFRI